MTSRSTRPTNAISRSGTSDRSTWCLGRGRTQLSPTAQIQVPNPARAGRARLHDRTRLLRSLRRTRGQRAIASGHSTPDMSPLPRSAQAGGTPRPPGRRSALSPSPVVHPPPESTAGTDPDERPGPRSRTLTQLHPSNESWIRTPGTALNRDVRSAAEARLSGHASPPDWVTNIACRTDRPSLRRPHATRRRRRPSEPACGFASPYPADRRRPSGSS